MVRSRHQLVERLALVFHDWWATSNDAVGSNQLMLDQTNVFRAHGLGSFRDDGARDHAPTRRCSLFLNGIDNRRGAVNENYARELMELFTLGADRGAYTETDVRELARSLTGWRADWSDGSGCTTSAGTTRPLGPGLQDRVRQDRPLRRGRTPCALVVDAPAARRRSSSPSCGATSSRRRRAADVAAALEALYVRLGHADPPGARGDPLLARSSTTARAWSSRRSCSSPGMLRARGARDHRRAVGLARRRRRPAALLPAGRLGLGRQALAGHEHDPRPLGRSSTTRSRADDHQARRGDGLPGRDRRGRRRRARARSGATRR